MQPRAAVLGLALASCAGGGARRDAPGPAFATDVAKPDDDFRSGTRLQARAYTAEGGAAILSAWHDATLDVDCTLVVAADGVQRCLPSSGSVVFTDDACTQAVLEVAVPACGEPPPPPKLVTTRRPTTVPCAAAPPEVRRVGGTRRRTGVFWTTSSNGCAANAAVGGPPPERDLYGLGDVVEPTSFVRVISVTRETRGAFAVARTVTEDGAMRLSPTTFDAVRGGACARTAFDDALRCVPAARATTSSVDGRYALAADAACARGVAAGAACGTSPPAVVLVKTDPTSACSPATFAEVGPPVDAPAYQRGGAGQCAARVPWSPPPAPFAQPSYYAIGPDLAPSSFPLEALGVEGTGRVRLLTEVTPAGERLHAAGLYDAARGAPCRPAKLDGAWRCVPSSTVSITTFADAACTRPLAMTAAGCPLTPAVGRVTYPTSAACAATGRATFVEIRGRVSPERTWRSSLLTGGCAEAPISQASAYYATTDISAAELPALAAPASAADEDPPTAFHDGPPVDLK